MMANCRSEVRHETRKETYGEAKKADARAWDKLRQLSRRTRNNGRACYSEQAYRKDRDDKEGNVK